MGFSLTPAQAYAGVLDYRTQAGMDIFKNMSNKLQAEGEELFSCEPEHLFQFLVDLQERASNFDWTATGGILMIPDANGNERNLLELFGAVTRQ